MSLLNTRASALPSLFTQIRLIAGLRWRMFRNGLRRSAGKLDLIGLVISSVLGSLLVLGLSAGCFTAALVMVQHRRESWLAALFWAIFLWWQLFPFLAAGFGASFEFSRLLRFPLRMSAFYLIALAYGMADFAALGGLCFLATILAALAIAAPAALPAMLALAAVFIFLNVALERLIASWLEKIFARRTWRELFVGLFLLAVSFIGMFAELDKTLPFGRALPYLTWSPGSLAGDALAGAIHGNSGEFVLRLAALVLYCFVLGGLLWRRLAAQFRGEELSETAAPARVLASTSQIAAERHAGLALLPPQVSAMVRKELLYFRRNMFLIINMVFPPLLILLFATRFAGSHSGLPRRSLPTGFGGNWFFPATMAYLVMILLAPAYNSFAYESRGMHAYFTLPVRFRDVLLAKNLVLLGVLAVEVVLSAAVLGWRTGFPPPSVFFSTVAAVAFSVAGQLTLANWSSLSFPKKMAFGSMRDRRNSGMAALIALLAQILFVGISALIVLAGSWSGLPWLPVQLFLFFTAAALAGYFASLDAFSQLAEQKKERLIETLCK